jgi:hypothetical protein
MVCAKAVANNKTAAATTPATRKEYQHLIKILSETLRHASFVIAS